MRRDDVVISVAGAMTDALREEFDDLDVTVDRSVTRIRVPNADQSALSGVMHRVESLGLELLELERRSDPA
jgi:hypothetical protein